MKDMPVNPESLIPEQHEGLAKEVRQVTEAANSAEALRIFQRAKERLLQSACWAATAEGASAKFLLYSPDGREILHRPAGNGDLVRIDLPAPGRTSASGYDWVRLENIAEGTDDSGAPWISLTTRPMSDPEAKSEGTAHFFSEGSTGTFIIRLRGNVVEGLHYGRNELPNTEGGNLLDKARAVLVTAGAYLGLSDVQWSNLVKGLISPDA